MSHFPMRKSLQSKRYPWYFKQGKKYAIVGKSGSGKSTLLKLLAGYYSDYGGEISVDGHADSICDISLFSQNVFLFDDTIRNNITLFGNYPQEAVDQVVHMAGLDAVVEESENGLETKVEENGSRFSGGERQRIAIARALLHHKSVLLLDEATSALDNENALRIEQNVLDLKNVTCIEVTHRMVQGLLRQYDKILVMENSRIVEQGSFEELMVRGDVFQHLYAELFEEAFYEKKGIEDENPQEQEPAADESSAGEGAGGGLDAETLMKLASSPELASILKMLAKNI